MKTKIALFLHRIGLSADLLTVLGFLLAGLSGWFIFQAMFIWAAVALLASGLADMLDGAVARVSRKAGVFGGILDSSLDRYSDSFVYMGLVFHFFDIARADLAAWASSAWIGSFLISYVRARAECEIKSCRVGFWERGERLGVLILALALDNIAPAVWILGIGTHWTVLQRLYASFREEHGMKTPSRKDAVYFVKVALLAGALILVRIT